MGINEKGGAGFMEVGPCSSTVEDFVPILPSILFSPSTVQACQHLLATNSEHCTGVGIKMGAAIGAKTIVLVWVDRSCLFKLLCFDDSLELFEVARALLSLSPGSARVNLISMALSGKNVDSPKSCP